MPGGKYPRRRGFNAEREVVNLARDGGLDAMRAYGSNGEAIGKHATVDVVISCRALDGEMDAYQVKRVKSIGNLYTIPDECDGLLMRGDRGEWQVTIRYTDYLDILRQLELTQEADT